VDVCGIYLDSGGGNRVEGVPLVYGSDRQYGETEPLPHTDILQRKNKFLGRALYFAWKKNAPFSLFDEPAFRMLFQPFHRDADTIVKAANRISIRRGILELGEITKECTKIEMKQHKGAATTDHWTGPASETYTTSTFHYIANWSLKKMLLDFKLHEGTTSGLAIFNDQKEILQLDNDECRPFCFFTVTDTTGNMGTLGAHLREHDIEHSYCVDHNMHRNAILAFKGKCTCLCEPLVCMLWLSCDLVNFAFLSQTNIFQAQMEH
jgi:hypothetical protein